MSDLISKQAAIDALRNYLVGKNFPCDGTLTCRLIENEVINKLPSEQTEIIRCKDCKYNATSKKCLNPNSFFLVPADDDFCSYAERREDG